jgi:RNA polymerase sigma factor (TIGR02999 family)
MLVYMTEVTQILSKIEQGDQAAAEQLLPLVYDELRRLAAHKLAQEKSGQTLQATDLVHEAYLRLVGPEDGQKWNGRGHFFGAAAEAMRRILVESARRKQTAKRGGGEFERDPIEATQIAAARKPEELLDVHEALEQLAASDGEAAELIKLRYFLGLTVEEAAECMSISPRKAKYLWAYARTWLHDALSDD